MELVACHCNWNIPGVESLPAHNHIYTGDYRDSGRFFERGPFKGQPIQQAVPDETKISIWVPWREVARALIMET